MAHFLAIPFILMIFSQVNLNLLHARKISLDSLDVQENDIPTSVNTRQYPAMFGPSVNGCPLCDSSVYSYCSYKLLHDSCCCSFPAMQQKPPQCYFYDCSLLYAKSCYEHSLIKTCCCDSPY